MRSHRLASIFKESKRRSVVGFLASLYRGVLCALVGLHAGCTVTEDVVQDEAQAVRRPPMVVAPPPGTPKHSQAAANQAAERMIADDEERIEFEPDNQALKGHRQTSLGDSELEMRARSTDAELGEAEGGAGSAFAEELGSVEADLGLEPKSPLNEKRPSLALGIARIKELYKKRSFEAALIETNRMLEFYPRSPQFLLMKGTLHQWLGQMDLALAAYREAATRRPSPKLAAQIRYLEMKIREREQLRGWVEGEVIPGGPEAVETSSPLPSPNPPARREGSSTKTSGSP